MNIFVTGATGFIGKHLVKRLSADGHRVCCLVRSAGRAQALHDPDLELIYGDVNDRQALQRGMHNCDWLFHLANLYSMWEPDNSRYDIVNAAGTRVVLECAAAAGVKKVVYVSTAAVYGKPDEVPFDENSRPGARLFSKYARSKAAADQLAWDFYRRGLPLVVLYPGIVLGAGDDKASGQYIQDIIRRRVPSTIFHNSSASYVYVGDVVEAMVRAAEKPATVGQRYLVGGTVLSGRAYARLISEVAGVKLPLLRLPDWTVLLAAYLLTGLSSLTRRPPIWGLSIDAGWTLKNGFQFDGSRAEKELGLQYTPIRQALSEAVQSYRQAWALPASKKSSGFARLFHKEVESQS